MSFSRKATSVISPRSISKSGLSPLASVAACIALPSVSVVIPVWSWKAMKDWISGVVRTPPKSEIDRLDPAARLSHRRGPPRSGRGPRGPRPTSGRRRSRSRAPAGAPRLALISVPAPRSGWPSSPSVQSSSVARRCTPSGPYSVESSVSETSTGAPSGPQRTADDLLVAVVAGARRAAPRSAPAGRRRRRRCRSTAAAPVRASSLIAAAAYSPGAELKPATIRSADPDRDAAACARSTRPTSRPAPPRSRRSRPSPRGVRRRGSRDVARPTLARRRARRRGGRLRLRLPAPLAARLPLGGRGLGLRRRGAAAPQGHGRALYARAGGAAARAAASTSPAPGSPCPTRPASPSTRASASCPSASTAGSAGRTAPGATSAGGSWS